MASTVHAYANSQVVTPVLTDGDPYERQLEAFAAAIRDGLAPNPGVRDGLAAVILIHATAEAVDSGKEVRL
jgi:predicted dehydrogenase